MQSYSGFHHVSSTLARAALQHPSTLVILVFEIHQLTTQWPSMAPLCPCLVHPPLGVHCVPCTPGSPGRQLVGSSWARPTPALRSKGLGDLCTASPGVTLGQPCITWVMSGKWGTILIDVCCHSDSTTQGHHGPPNGGRFVHLICYCARDSQIPRRTEKNKGTVPRF